MEAVSARRLAALVGDLSTSRPPRYEALAVRVRLLVSDGRLPVGARLPAERDLAAALGVSRATTGSAYARLRTEGWAVARQGAGTWTALPAAGASRSGAWVPRPAPDGVLDLVHAAPAAPPQVHAAFAAALELLPRHLPTHGYVPQGLPDLRARVAERFTRRGLPTVAEEVLVTSGGLHAVALALEVVARRGDRLLVEHPTYPNALDAAGALGLRAVPVAVPDRDSADDPHAAFVRDVARTASLTGAPAAYLVPDFQNPTGQLLGAVHRERLAVGLRRAGTTAVVDENLVDLGIDADPPPPQASYDPSRTATAGSLSKVAWGGLRVGWLRAEREVVQRAATLATRHRLAEPLLEQLAACALLDDLDAVVEVRRAELRERRDALVAALARHLPDWRVDVPAGGLVLWCRLPAARATALVARAEERGLRLAPGPRFGTGHAFDDRLRLPFTPPVEVLERAVRLLAEVDAEVAASPRPVDAPERLRTREVV